MLLLHLLEHMLQHDFIINWFYIVLLLLVCR